MLRRVAVMVECVELRPRTDRIVPFAEFGAALDALEAGQTIGLVVLAGT